MDPRSIIEVPESDGCPVFPKIRRDPDDPFLRRLDRSGRKWAIAVDADGEPYAVINADGFLRDALWATC